MMNSDQQLTLFDAIVEIFLPSGLIAQIDPCDNDLLVLHWHSCKNRSTYYVVGNGHSSKKREMIKLHRIIMSRKLGRDIFPQELVDHIDGDGLNNRRANLRIATNSENTQNQRRRSDNTSGYKGVCFKRQENKWCAQISVGRTRKHLGYFRTPEAAYAAYCKAAIEHYGEFARLD